MIGWKGEQQEAPWGDVQSDNHVGRGGEQRSSTLKIFFFFLSRIRFVHGSARLRFRALLSSVVSQTGFGRRSDASPAHHHCLAALLFSVRPCFTAPSRAQLGRSQKMSRFVFFIYIFSTVKSLCWQREKHHPTSKRFCC